MTHSSPTQVAELLKKQIQDFINLSPENTLNTNRPEKAFSTPLVGFSRGDDSIFEDYKEHVGPFHLTPLEVFSDSFPTVSVTARDLTVISWILPHTEVTKKDNRKETSYPSERWARARIFGEEVNNKLRKHVLVQLQKAGYEAVAPVFSPLWKTSISSRFGRASTWSERHAAYASGLGTFGLCDGLITAAGKAMRTGSVVARIQAQPTARPYEHHRQYCLYFTSGTCGKCIKRCPVDAISKEGHDKEKCFAYLKPVTADYVKTHFKFDGYGCGLCQTKVPCESKIPEPGDLKAYEE
ncbi:MAG: epoxyqueuosine reductase [Deltaproteobacteria bacterium]|nr:epoxyqueuosine reductase [Deltaproteobacteria bacterium]